MSLTNFFWHFVMHHRIVFADECKFAKPGMTISATSSLSFLGQGHARKHLESLFSMSRNAVQRSATPP